MPLSDQEVFQLTKIIYKDIYQNFSENYIGQKDPLQEFQENYIQPLYPEKKTQQQKPPDSPLRQKISQYRHKYDQQIQFSQSAQSAESQDDNSDVSYVSAVQKYSLADLICKLRLGRFFCWKTVPPDNVYEDLGLGICLYLKFMKHLVYVLLILTALSAIVMSIFYSIAQSNKYQPGLNYQKVLFSLGVGSLSLEGIKCIHENVTNTAIQFDLVCPVGFVRVIGPVYTNSQFQTLQTCKQDILTFTEQTPSLYLAQKDYFHITNCNQQVQSCTYNVTVASPDFSYQQISVPYECINGKNTYGVVQISRSSALYVAVVFDLLMIVSLMMFFWSQSSAEKKEQKYFKQKQILLNAFTLEIGTFSKRNFDQEFKQFIQDIQKQIKKEDNLQLNLRKCIVQVRLPDNDEYDHDQRKREDAYRQMYDFIGEHFIQKQLDPNKYVDGQDFKKSIFSSQKQFKSYRRKLGELIKDYRKFQKLKGKNHDEQLKIYVVFLKPKYKRLILEKTKIILGLQILQTSKKDYQIIDPPAPAMVRWNNIGKNKLARGIISWFVSFLILLGTFVLTAYILSLQNDTVVGQYDFNIQCQNVFPDENYKVFDQQEYMQYKLSYTHCYCLSRSIIFSLNFQPVCNQWRDQYTLFLAIPVLYGLGLFVLNQIVSGIYKKLSEFQAHQYLTSELYSFIIKKTILETTDLALFVILLSINFNKKSTTFDFLLIGSYDDVSADWHLEVGIVIIINMVFNMFSPFVEGIAYAGESIVRRLKLCFFHKKSSYNKTKMEYIEYYREDVFPVEQRYASILAILFISLALNCVYPIMNVIMTLSLLLYQIVDKIMIVKAYHKPLNYEGLLQRKIMKVFLVAILIHIVVTAFFLTEPFLIVAGDSSNQASITEQTNSRIGNMFKVGYVMPYMILFIVVIICVAIIYTSNHYFLTKPNPRIRLGLGGIPFEENKYYNLLDAYELDRTIALKRRQIQRNKILEKSYMKKMSDEDNLRQSYSNKPMIPTKRKDLILNANKSILSEISEYSYYRLLKKKIKTSKQQQKLVKLAGMTAYQWQQDWIYFDQQVRLDYKISQIDSYLNKMSQEAENRRQLIQSIIQLAMLSQSQLPNDSKNSQIKQQIQQQKIFQEIINISNVTSVQEKQDNLLQIQNTHLPIAELQKQIQEMQKASARSQRSHRNISKRDSRQLRGSEQQFVIRLKTKNSIDANKFESKSDRDKQDNISPDKKGCKQLPHIHQLVREENNMEQIHQNGIVFQIPEQREEKQKNRKNSSTVEQQNEQKVNQRRREYIQDTAIRQHSDQPQKQQILQPQQQSVALNSSQQEDNQIQIQVIPAQEKQTIFNLSQERIKQEKNKSQQKDIDYLNQLPTQKVLMQEQEIGEIGEEENSKQDNI